MFCLHGFLRGTVAQVFVVLGLFAGLWAASWVARWLDHHWHGAQPALVYWALRWIVAALAGLGAASLFQWWGDSLGRAVHSGPTGWVDRGGGLAVGAAMGLGTVAVVLMVGLLVPQPRALASCVADTRAAVPFMTGAAEACSRSARYLPGGPWLAERFRSARRRAEEVRADRRPPKS